MDWQDLKAYFFHPMAYPLWGVALVVVVGVVSRIYDFVEWLWGGPKKVHWVAPCPSADCSCHSCVAAGIADGTIQFSDSDRGFPEKTVFQNLWTPPNELRNKPEPSKREY